jgi:DNA-binding NtrC family response regulator
MPLNSKLKILYVDDEINNLESFKANFRRYYTIYTATSAAEAKQVLSKEPDIQLLITDQKMPGTSGTKLLEQAVLDYPQQIRILLTAYSDTTTILGAFQKGLIYRYVLKPYAFEELKQLMDSALELYALKKQKAILYQEWLRTQDELDLLKKNEPK